MGKSSGNLEFMKTHAVSKGCDVLAGSKPLESKIQWNCTGFKVDLEE
jgi:hypothetical protein